MGGIQKKRVLGFSFVLWLLTSLAFSGSGNSSPVQELSSTPIERELKGGETHRYTIKLKVNEYISLVVEQKGIDIVVTLLAPDGNRLQEVDSPNGTQGPEPLLFISEKAGEYWVEIRSLEKEAATGKYELKLVEVRPPIAQDYKRLEAEQLLREANGLRFQSTKDSLEKAIKKYLESVPLLTEIGETRQEAEALNNIGVVYDDLGEKAKALEYYGQALPLRKAVGDQRGEAETLNNLGTVYTDLGDSAKALEYYGQALPLRKAVRDQSGEAVTLNNIGALYANLGEQRKALEYYTQALPLRKAVGDQSGEAATLNNMGTACNILGDQTKALEYYSRALLLLKRVGDQRGEASVLTSIGKVYSDFGEKTKALEYYFQALPLRKAVGDRRGEAATLTNIGTVYNALGNQAKALEYYSQALPLRKAVRDRSGEAVTLTNIGTAYNTLGEKRKALEYYSQALVLEKAVGDRSGEAVTLNNIGAVYADLGEKGKALRYYLEALPLRKLLEDRIGEAATLTNIGAVYNALGEQARGVEYYNQALPLYKIMRDRSGEAVTLNNIGKLYFDLGENAKALEYYTQALPLRKAVGDRRGEATTLNNIGAVYNALGDQAKAFECYHQALALRKSVGDQFGEAVTLNNISGAYAAMGEPAKASEYQAQALPLYQAVGDRQGEATTLTNIGLTERKRGNFAKSRQAFETALTVIESLRADIGNKDLQVTYFAGQQNVYLHYIDLLMEMHRQDPKAGHHCTALETSERTRARNLLELLNESNANIREGVEPTLLEQEQQVQQKILTLEQQRTQFLSDSKTEATGQALTKQIDELLNEYQIVQAQIRQKSPRYAALTQPKPLTVKEIQTQVLDPETILLEYSLGKERSFLWLVTSKEVKSWELPKEADIEALARPGYESLIGTRGVKVIDGVVEDDLPKLSQILLGPVATKLNKKRLVIVADGVLHYLPFSALPLPNQSASNTRPKLLIDEHEIISLPSASTLAVIRNEQKDRVTSSKGIAVLADPVFSTEDERLKSELAKTQLPSQPRPVNDFSEVAFNTSRSREAFSNYRKNSLDRLPGTEREARTILELMPENTCLKALGFDASRTSAMSGNLKPFRYVHFATHGLLDSQRPEFSSIALSMFDRKGEAQDGFVRTFDVYNLQLTADVVTLSACQTGLGKSIRGEGLVGLTRGFMYAGSPRVIVSLWSVNDEATAELMTRFYQRMISGKERPAAALRAAQQQLRKMPQWSAPYYWAAFTLQGEWK